MSPSRVVLKPPCTSRLQYNTETAGIQDQSENFSILSSVEVTDFYHTQ